MTEQPGDPRETPLSEGVAEGEESDLQGTAREVIERDDDQPEGGAAKTPGGG